MTKTELFGCSCIVVYCSACRLFRLGKQGTWGIGKRGGCSNKGSPKEVVSEGESRARKKKVKVLLEERCGMWGRTWRSGKCMLGDSQCSWLVTPPPLWGREGETW